MKKQYEQPIFEIVKLDEFDFIVMSQQFGSNYAGEEEEEFES